MMTTKKKILTCALLSVFALQAFAADKIKVTVKSSEKEVFGLGFTVNKKQHGGMGKSYSGKGPANQTYSFGYRKDSMFGKDINCGTLFLTESSTVILIKDGDVCHSILG